MRDGRVALAGVMVIGIMTLIGLAMFAPIADGSQRIVDGGIGALCVALGNAIAGIFRTDQADEQRARNTGAAFESFNAAISATPNDRSTGRPDEPVTEN